MENQIKEEVDSISTNVGWNQLFLLILMFQGCMICQKSSSTNNGIEDIKKECVAAKQVTQ